MSLLGYIDNIAVYDQRLATEAVKARVPARIKQEHLEGTRCLVLVKETALWRTGFYFKLRDGLAHEGKVTATFYEKGGKSLFLSKNDLWHQDARRVVKLEEIRQHHCHAIGCKRDIAPKYLMCRIHWNMVPKEIQNAVWQTYQAGQELGKVNPTAVYLEAAELACKTVQALEAQSRAEREKRDEEFAARKRERQEKQIRKKGGKAAKPLFKEQA